MIEATTLNEITWFSSDAVDAQPGTTWPDIVNFSLSKGRTPPVLPDTLFLTVGGTLSVGGIGETSYRLGAQVDHALEMEVVTGKGNLVTCAPERQSDRSTSEITLREATHGDDQGDYQV